jgi:hypothetical protein
MPDYTCEETNKKFRFYTCYFCTSSTELLNVMHTDIQTH